MKKRRLALLFLISFVFLLLPVSTPTQIFKLRVTAEFAELYEGPGNAGYKTITRLAKGTAVSAIGAYGDFIKVQTASGGKIIEGFLTGQSLDNIPGSLPRLNPEQVPWQETVDIAALPAWNTWSTWVEKGILRHNNTTTLFEDYYTLIDDYEPIPVPDLFDVKIQFTGQGTDYGILLCGRLNAGGEWWRGIRRLDLHVYRENLNLLFFDGTKIDALYVALPQSLMGKLSTLRFQDGGSTITLFGPDGAPVWPQPLRLNLPLFPDKVMYAGVNAAPKTQLAVSAFSMRIPPSGKFISATAGDSSTQSPPLRELAEKRGIQIGAFLSMQDLHSFQIFNREYNRMICENFHWAQIRPGRNDYDFRVTDLLVAFANRNGIALEAHHLVWGAAEHLPDWLTKGKFNKEELLAILHEHINTVVTRYKGKVNTWSIANEVSMRQHWGGGDLDFWYKNIGPEYVELAFRWAKEVDPNAILILNDDQNEGRQTDHNVKIFESMYELVKQLKHKGVPIDAVGFQMHLLAPFAQDKKHPPKKEDVIANMKRMAGLGVVIFVTEFDVNLTEVPGSQNEKWAFQARVYGDMLQACLAVPACKGFSVFGISDGTSWYNVCPECLNLPNAEPLPFDRNFNPKPAYYAMRDVLSRK